MQKLRAKSDLDMKCYSITFIDNTGKLHEVKIAAIEMPRQKLISSAYRTLLEGKNVAATVLVDSIHEIDAI